MGDELEEDARRSLDRAAERDQPPRLGEINAAVSRHQRGTGGLEAEVHELLEPPPLNTQLLSLLWLKLNVRPLCRLHAYMIAGQALSVMGRSAYR